MANEERLSWLFEDSSQAKLLGRVEPLYKKLGKAPFSQVSLIIFERI